MGTGIGCLKETMSGYELNTAHERARKSNRSASECFSHRHRHHHNHRPHPQHHQHRQHHDHHEQQPEYQQLTAFARWLAKHSAEKGKNMYAVVSKHYDHSIVVCSLLEPAMDENKGANKQRLASFLAGILAMRAEKDLMFVNEKLIGMIFKDRSHIYSHELLQVMREAMRLAYSRNGVVPVESVENEKFLKSIVRSIYRSQTLISVSEVEAWIRHNFPYSLISILDYILDRSKIKELPPILAGSGRTATPLHLKDASSLLSNAVSWFLCSLIVTQKVPEDMCRSRLFCKIHESAWRLVYSARAFDSRFPIEHFRDVNKAKLILIKTSSNGMYALCLSQLMSFYDCQTFSSRASTVVQLMPIVEFLDSHKGVVLDFIHIDSGIDELCVTDHMDNVIVQLSGRSPTVIVVKDRIETFQNLELWVIHHKVVAE